jgi:hypothetical protein
MKDKEKKEDEIDLENILAPYIAEIIYIVVILIMRYFYLNNILYNKEHSYVNRKFELFYF